jgi:hypothetical protein
MRHPLDTLSPHVPSVQACEQQSLSAVQGSPTMWHMGAPHTPFQQPSEQQSYASRQALPSAKQCSVQVVSSSPGSFWQCPLQQELLLEHAMPCGLHTLGSMQTPPTQ